nr:hypothetical protein [Tanacetum cinerariifolium]GEV06580.1 hypothetical protein [Tanacetum cinerariifolium]
MAAAAQNTNNLTIRSILHAKKLTGPNLTNWYQNLRIFLRSENKLAHLEQPLIHLLVPVASQVARDANALFNAQNEVACLMLGNMSPDNCHFAPTITKGIVLISRLVDNGYIHTFTNYGIYVSKDNVFYFNAIPHDGIYGIDMHNLYSDASSIYNVSNIRSKHELDSSYLWHYRLGRINKKCMDKLQRDGILQPTHDESLKNGYALESAGRILNMVPTKKVDRTPYKIWHGKAPKLSYLKVWGCEAHVKRDTLDKLDSNSIKCIFIGYPKETIGYYFYNLLRNKIFVAQSVEFFENSLTLEEASGNHKMLEASGSDVGLELFQKDDTRPFENTSTRHDVTPSISDSNRSTLFVDPRSPASPTCSYISKMGNFKRGSTPMQEKPDYRKSQGAQTPSEDNVFVLNGGAVDWKSANQRTTTMSSTEAKYIAADKASMEAVWMRKFIDELGDVMPSNKRHMEMLCGNAHAIAIANDTRIMRGARHYQRKYHYVHKVIQAGEIVLKKVHTYDNLADPFTKPMPYNNHFGHAMGIGVCPASSLM